MGRVGDIIWMVIGVVMLIVVSTSDAIRFRYGVVGYIGAFACIGYGIKSIYDGIKDKELMEMELLSMPVVEEFYKNTKQAWMDNKLKSLGSGFKAEGNRSSIKQLKKRYLPYEGSAFHTFLTRFNPGPDEYLVSLSHGTSNKDNAWFILTNSRLIQKDGQTDEFREFELKDIQEYNVSRLKAEMNITKRSGEVVTLKKLSYFPGKKYVDFLISEST
jgi:hypothetical protein